MQRGFPSAANQLEHLHDKLNFTNTACAKLNIVFQTATTHFTGNHPFHITQGLDHAEIDIAAEHERSQHGAQFIDIHTVGSAHNARFDHRITLPVAPLFLVIIFQRGKTQHQRATVAKRAQTHIHPVHKAVHRRLVQHFDQTLPHAGKELRVIQLAPTAPGGTVLRPGEDQIDIRGEIQLAAAQFSHPQNQQRLRYAIMVAGRPPFATAGVIQPVARGDDQRFRQMA